ncbi:hypothetical protein WL553_13835, partial [Staphylococcus epidermidis]
PNNAQDTGAPAQAKPEAGTTPAGNQAEQNAGTPQNNQADASVTPAQSAGQQGQGTPGADQNATTGQQTGTPAQGT